MEGFICCLEDAEIAIDDFVNAFETFPIMETYEEGTCDYCGKPSQYRLKKPETPEESAP